MSDPFATRLEQHLVAAERRLAPTRRRWPKPLLALPLALVAISVPALAVTRPWHDEYSGYGGSQTLRVTAPVPDTSTEVGVITYRSRKGLPCLVAGPVKGGMVGRYRQDGSFYALDAADAPGSCGDIAENLAQFGGIALGHGPGDIPEGDFPIFYGFVAKRDTIVRIRWRDGRTELARVSPTGDPSELQGAEGTFAVAGAPGDKLRGKVDLLRPDGTLIHTFEF